MKTRSARTNNASRSGGCWPEPGQELLLKAALLSGHDAVTAWNAWLNEVGMDRIDAGSQRLLPLVHRNMRANGVDHPLMKTLRGIYRRTWYENQILFHQMAPLLRALEEAGVRTMLLKGAALVSLYYNDLGLRPMSDLDVLVPTDEAARAIRVLLSESCTPLGNRTAPLERLLQSEVFKEWIHSEHFAESGGREFDLHWHTLTECLAPDADADFWNAAVPTVLNNVATRALNSADQLLHVCFHGAEWNRVPPVRWIADAMVVMRSSSVIDWQRLVSQASERGLVLHIRNALSYLSDTFAAPIPADILQDLQQAQVSRKEISRYQSRIRPPHFASDSLLLVRRYLQSTSRAELGHPLVGFPRFLQQVWGLDRKRQVPVHIASAALERLRRKWRSLKRRDVFFSGVFPRGHR